MPKRVAKSADKVGRLSLAKVREVLRAMRRERGDVVIPKKGKVVITNETTASGRGLIHIRGFGPPKAGDSKAQRRPKKGK